MTTGLNLSKLTPKDIVRIHWLVTVTLIILLAMLAAKLSSAITGMYLVDLKTKNVIKDKSVKTNVEQDVEVQRLAKYDVIVTRNLFNSKNEIPEDILKLTAPGEATKKSSLDIELVGTIVVNDSSRSVAAIALKTQKKVEPFIIGDVILSKASIFSIARRKVVLKDLSTGEFEYIEMKSDDDTVSSPGFSSSSGVKQISEGRILLEKAELNKSLSDINSLLSQARAIPNFENGAVSGFKLFDIQPGSLYQKLGAQNGDIIKSVNGVDIKDPATAMGLFQRLQTTSKLDFMINRNGENKNFSVEIR
ncbi:MAG: type II secretion system protein GspC [bacterium]